jgi:hypothetical protein
MVQVDARLTHEPGKSRSWRAFRHARSCRLGEGRAGESSG